MALLCFSSMNANAQMQVNGANLLNFGLGIGADPSSFGVNVSYEHGFFDAVSIGGIFDYRTGSHYYFNTYNERVNQVGLAFRGSYHFNKLLRIKQDNFDIYAGAALGLKITNYGYDDFYANHHANSTDPLIGIHAGAKYFINNNFGFFGELSTYNSVLKIGLAFKF